MNTKLFDNYPYLEPVRNIDQFPIMAWGPIPYNLNINDMVGPEQISIPKSIEQAHFSSSQIGSSATYQYDKNLTGSKLEESINQFVEDLFKAEISAAKDLDLSLIVRYNPELRN